MISSNSLTDKAMLVRLSITQWTARKLDKRVTEEVRAHHGASADAGRYNKALVSADAIKAIQQTATAAREMHYRYTLPWRDDGARILPAAAFLEYTGKMRALEADFNAAVNTFVGDYPLYVADARFRLNGMFRQEDYPGVDSIRARFSWAVSVDPLPTGADFRVELSDGEADRIRQAIDESTRDALAAGLRDAFTRLHDALSHAADRLGDPKAIFRDSLIGNLQELCSILPLLNFASDPALERARIDVQNRLAGLSPDDLRNDARARERAAADARNIMADMAAFMGGAQ